MDPIKNFAKVTVSIPYDYTQTSIMINSGDGAKLPNPSIDGFFNLTWWNYTDYPDPADDPNKEIVRCMVNSLDTLTISRPQEGTIATDKNIVGKTYKMILSMTAKTISDLQLDAQNKVNTHSTLSTGVHGVGINTVDSIEARNSALLSHSIQTMNIHNFDVSGNAPAQTHGSSRHAGTIGDHTNLTSIGSNTHTQIDAAVTATAGHIAASSAHGTSGNIVGTTDAQSLTNKTITDPTNNVMAKSLKSATTTIDVSAATAPTTGQVLTATGPNTATWQAASGSAMSVIQLSSTTGAFPQTATGTSSTTVSKLVDLTPYPSNRILGLSITIYAYGRTTQTNFKDFSATINGITFANSRFWAVDNSNFGGMYFIPRTFLHLTSNETIVVNSSTVTGSNPSVSATIQNVQVIII